MDILIGAIPSYLKEVFGVVAGIILILREWKARKVKVELKDVKVQLKEREVNLIGSALDWANIYQEMLNVCRDTDINRVMLFASHNGIEEPKRAHCKGSLVDGEFMVGNHFDVKLDTDYKQRLRETFEKGVHSIPLVSELPKSLIKEIYQGEGVNSSSWIPVSKVRLENGVVVWFYYSVATFLKSQITTKDVLRCQKLISLTKDLVDKGVVISK